MGSVLQPGPEGLLVVLSILSTLMQFQAQSLILGYDQVNNDTLADIEGYSLGAIDTYDALKFEDQELPNGVDPEGHQAGKPQEV